MIAWRAIATLVGLLLALVLMVVAAGTLTGGMGELWAEIRTPVLVLSAILAAGVVSAVMMIAARVRGRGAREMVRYQLVLAQADEATHEEIAQACDALVQMLRCTLVSRVCGGQPWLAIESWHVPPATAGETGTALLMILCEPQTLDPAIAALRRAYPNLTVRHDRETGAPAPYVSPRFSPEHVLRVRKARDWALPIGAIKGSGDTSNARSVMASVIRQQQQLGKTGYLSCVRWCLMPADESVDGRAARRLRRMADSTHTVNAAVSADVMEAQRGGGGALCFLELQSAIQHVRGDGERRGFADLQPVCRLLVSPALTQRSVNTLMERQMIVRQALYRRRWERGTPPLIPDQTGATLVFPAELALTLEFPGLGSEHGLPLQRNTVPWLPAPPGLTRAGHTGMPLPPSREAYERGFRISAVHAAGSVDGEVVDGELIAEA